MPSPTTLEAEAYCGAGPAIVENAATLHLIDASGTKTVTAYCPSGKHFLLGGFAGAFPWPEPGPEVLAGSMWSPSIGKWSVTGQNPSIASGTLTAYAYCR